MSVLSEAFLGRGRGGGTGGGEEGQIASQGLSHYWVLHREGEKEKYIKICLFLVL